MRSLKPYGTDSVCVPTLHHRSALARSASGGRSRERDRTDELIAPSIPEFPDAPRDRSATAATAASPGIGTHNQAYIARRTQMGLGRRILANDFSQIHCF